MQETSGCETNIFFFDLQKKKLQNTITQNISSKK